LINLAQFYLEYKSEVKLGDDLLYIYHRTMEICFLNLKKNNNETIKF